MEENWRAPEWLKRKWILLRCEQSWPWERTCFPCVTNGKMPFCRRSNWCETFFSANFCFGRQLLIFWLRILLLVEGWTDDNDERVGIEVFPTKWMRLLDFNSIDVPSPLQAHNPIHTVHRASVFCVTAFKVPPSSGQQNKTTNNASLYLHTVSVILFFCV